MTEYIILLLGVIIVIGLIIQIYRSGHWAGEAETEAKINKATSDKVDKLKKKAEEIRNEDTIPDPNSDW